MRVRCKINDLAAIDSSARVRLSLSINRSGPDYGLEIDEDYVVYAVELMRGGIWIYIETSGRDYPFPYPIEFFEIVDSSIPVHWLIAAPYRPGSAAIISFEKWVRDHDFYEKLLNDSPASVSAYRSETQDK